MSTILLIQLEIKHENGQHLNRIRYYNCNAFNKELILSICDRSMFLYSFMSMMSSPLG